MSDQRDAIAAAIRNRMVMTYPLTEGEMESFSVRAADAVAPFVDAARVEGERRGLARAITAVKAAPSQNEANNVWVSHEPERWIARDTLLAVLEQQEDAG